MSSKEITYESAMYETIHEEMRANPAIFVMGEEIVHRYPPEFDGRVFAAPISEPGFHGAGLGAAITGMRPIVHLMFVDLAFVAMDQICNQIAKARYMSGGKLKVPLVMIAPEGASGGAAAQHSQSLEGLFVHIPGLKIVVPSTPYDMKGLMKTALRDWNPVFVFPHKSLNAVKGLVPVDDYTIPFGQADVKKHGKDVTIVAWLNMVPKSLAAAQELEKEHIDVEVIDPRTLVPLDENTILDSVKKTGRLVVVQEENKRNGAAAEIVSMVAEKGFDYLEAPIERVAAKDVPIPYSLAMERYVIPQVTDIINVVKEVASYKQKME